MSPKFLEIKGIDSENFRVRAKVKITLIYDQSFYVWDNGFEGVIRLFLRINFQIIKLM